MSNSKFPLLEELGVSELLSYAAKTCVRCGTCKPVCSTHPYGGGFESYSPRAKMNFLQKVMRGEEEFTPEWVDRFYQCTTCERCDEVCQTEIPIVEIWEAVRAELVNQGLGPMPNHTMFRDNANKFNNAYGEPTDERGKWMLEHHKPTEGAELLVFGGCTASYKMPPMLQSGVSILMKMGMPFAYAGANEYCCGSPIIRTGQLEAAKRVISNNIDYFNEHGVKRIVTPCAGCSKTLRFDYPKWGRNLGKKFDIEVMHFSKLYVKLLEEGKLKPTKPVDMTVTYHDPCHLGRSQGFYDEPRQILAAIPGLKLVEMEHIRADAHCCGAGGGVRAQYPNIADDLAAKRIKQAEATGADALVTMCPFCQSSFALMKKETNSKLEVHGVEDLLVRSL
ncbi:MAG: (Fe-S)-binding protein [Nitrospinota bacterium]